MNAQAALAKGTTFQSDVPGRLDRLPWAPWHWRVIVALGVTWILDGLEVTIVGAVAAVLGEPDTLQLTDTQIGSAASAYLAGAIAGSLIFGRLTDVYGRKRLFLVTLALYLGATLLTAASWGFVSFCTFRALTGAAIGGECAAMNSAIDELVPARVRGRVDLAINGTYWVGTAIGSASTLILLDAHIVPHAIGWRVAFGLGALLSGSIILVRRHLPESPRWLLSHGRIEDAERVVAAIEEKVAGGADRSALPAPGPARTLRVTGSATFSGIVHVLLRHHRRRTALGLCLMTAQAFAYNAIFFTYALVLHRFYGVPSDRVGLYLIPFAIGNWFGPLALGGLFDTIGRRTMIAATYGLAALLLAMTAYAFARGWLTAASQTALWCAVFFVASAAASSAYLTVSELFPVELRGLAIALFYSVGTFAGGLLAPALFGALIQSGSRARVAEGYVVGAALMMIAALVALWLGVAAEGKSLEQIAFDVSPTDTVRRTSS
jgi:MFS family permease